MASFFKPDLQFKATWHVEAENQGELPNLEWANARLLAEVRLGLIVTAFLLVLFQPATDSRIALPVILAAYSIFGVTLWRNVVQRKPRAYFAIAHWVDAAAYASLVALSGALQSRFAIFLLFPIVGASFQRGLRPGMGLALICMLWWRRDTKRIPALIPK